MANEVKLTLKVNDDGGLAIVAKEAKSAAGATEKLGKSTDKLNKSQRQAYRINQGTAGNSANTTKNFSKQVGVISGGLVPAYAALAANVFAVTAAFNVLQRAAAVKQLEQGLIAVGAAAGTNLPYLANQLRDITGAAISAEQAMRATAVASSAGFSGEQLANLTKVAKGASLALGRDMGDALDRLVRGTAKLEPEILDELGIMVRLDDAVSEYAGSLGKTAAELTQFERRQAFLNETIDQGLAKFALIADSLDPTPYDRLGAAFDDLQKSTIGFLNMGLAPVVELLAESPVALIGVLGALGGTVVRQLTPAFTEMADSQANLTSILSEQANQLKGDTLKNYKSVAKQIKGMDFVPASIKGSEKQYKEGSRGILQMKKDVKALATSERIRDTKLTEYEATGSGRSAQFIAQKRAELEAIRALKRETQELITAEAGRGGLPAVSAQAQYAGVRAEKSDAVAGGLAMMGGGVRSDFKEANKAFQSVRDKGKGVTGTLNKIKSGFGTAGAGAKLFGAASLSLLGPLSLVAMAVGALMPLIMRLFEDSKLEKTVKEVTASFENFSNVSSTLQRVLESTTSSEVKLQSTLKARAGIMNSISDGIMRAARVEEEEREKRMSDLREEIRLLNEPVNSRSSATAKGRKETKGVKEGELQAELDELGTVSTATALGILDNAVARINNNEVLTQAMSKEMTKLTELRATIAESGDRVQMTKITKATDASTAATNKAKSALKGLSDSLSAVNKSSTAVFSKKASPYADLIRDLSKAEQEIKSFVEAGENFETFGEADKKKITSFAEQFINVAGRSEEAFKKFEGAGFTSGSSIEDTYSAGVTLLQQLQDELVVAAAKSAEHAERAKQLKEFSKENAVIMSVMLDHEKKAAEFKLQEKENALLILELTHKEGQSKSEINRLTAEIAALNVKIKDTEEDTLRTSEARTRGLKRQVDMIKKAADIEVNLQQALLKNDMDRARLAKLETTSEGLTPREELDVINKGAKARKTARTAALNAELQSIDLEYKLMDIKFKLERFRLKTTLLEMKGREEIGQQEIDNTLATFDAAAGLVTKTRDAAIQLAATKMGVEISTDDAANLERDAAGILKPLAEQTSPTVKTAVEGAAPDKDDLDATLKERLILEKAREESLRAINLESERAAALGLEETAARLAVKAAEEDLSNVRTDNQVLLDNLKNGSIELKDLTEDQLNTVNDLREKENALLEKKLELLAEEVDKTTRLRGETAGAFDQFTGGLELNIDDKGKFMDGKPLSEKMETINDASQDLIKNLSSLGPEGEVMAAMAQAGLNMAETFSKSFETIKESGLNSTEGLKAGFQAAGAVISGMRAISEAKSKAAIAGIDDEIKAEKRRDGTSAKSLAKIKQLEAKKEAIKKKQFEKDKKMKMGEVMMATAVAIMNSIKMGLPWGLVFGTMAAAMGAAQLSAIASSSYQGGGATSKPGGAASSVNMGQRSNVVDVSQRQSRGELAYLRGQRGVGTNANNFTPAFYGSKKMRAAGGAVAGYTVGEQGPELFVPQVPGQIVPNDEVTPAQPINVNFNVQAIDSSSFNDALTVQRGNIISIIREAANGSGEGFLETVDVESLKMER